MWKGRFEVHGSGSTSSMHYQHSTSGSNKAETGKILNSGHIFRIYDSGSPRGARYPILELFGFKYYDTCNGFWGLIL